MASGFSRDEDKCQGLECQASTGVTYYVEEKKKLCKECADRIGCVTKVRKNESKLICLQHDEPKKLFCVSHGLAVCHLCSQLKHQKPCQLEDIDVILEDMRQGLLNVKQSATDKNILLNGHREKILACEQFSKTHLKAVTSEMNSVLNEGSNKIRENEEKLVTIINEEADEEIKRTTDEINKKREARLKKCREDAEKERTPIENRRSELLEHITEINKNTLTKLNDLQTEARDVVRAIDHATQRIETFLENDEELLNGGQQLIASISETLEKTVDEDSLDSITSKVESVKFKRGVGHEKYNGRIWHDGKWELSMRVVVPIECQKLSEHEAPWSEYAYMYIAGYTQEDEAIVCDNFKTCMFIVNMNTGNVERMNIPSKIISPITSCAKLDDDIIVCAMELEISSGDSTSRCIHLYDRQWSLIRDITIPINRCTELDDMTLYVDVAVDQDGMIIAAEWGQPHIYTINPADGHIVKDIKCETNIMMCGVLSSGHIVARSAYMDELLYNS